VAVVSPSLMKMFPKLNIGVKTTRNDPIRMQPVFRPGPKRRRNRSEVYRVSGCCTPTCILYVARRQVTILKVLALMCNVHILDLAQYSVLYYTITDSRFGTGRANPFWRRSATGTLAPH
jgi:hypothetical protein